MQPLTYSYCTHIVARELICNPLEYHFDSLCILASQLKMMDVIITKTTITATEKNYNILLKRLIDCVYQN